MSMVRISVVLFTLLGAASVAAQTNYLDPPTSYAANGVSAVFDSAVAGDLNADGREDIVMAVGSGIVTFLSTAQGDVGPAVVSVFPQPGFTDYSLPLLHDFDQDGDLDLVLNEVTTGPQVFRGDGAGGWMLWQGALSILPSPFVYRPALVDLDVDGVPELLYPTYLPFNGFQVISLLSGTFTYLGDIPAAYASVGRVKFGDLNGDGLQDLIGFTGTSGSMFLNQVIVALGDGTLSGFAPPLTFGFPFPATNQVILALADANGDGSDDVIIHSWDPGSGFDTSPPPSEVWSTIDLLTGASWNSYPAPGMRGVIDTADINQDGFPDLFGMENYGTAVWPNMSPRSQVGVLLGDGTGGFLAPQLMVPPGGFVHDTLGLADVDGDGDPDPFIMEYFSAGLGLLRNRARFGDGCSGLGRVGPQISAGSSRPGNSLFSISLSGAPATSGALLAVSLARGPTTGPCQVLVDFNPANLILPLGNWGITTTDAAGNATVAIGVPSDPALVGISAFAQWGVLDPNAPAGVALTQGAEMIIW